jgi:hypothetical protein
MNIKTEFTLTAHTTFFRASPAIASRQDLIRQLAEVKRVAGLHLRRPQYRGSEPRAPRCSGVEVYFESKTNFETVFSLHSSTIGHFPE